MRSLSRLLLLALFCMVSMVMNANNDNIVRILAIGNSFSQDAVEQYLHELAAQKSAHAAVRKPHKVTEIK